MEPYKTLEGSMYEALKGLRKNGKKALEIFGNALKYPLGFPIGLPMGNRGTNRNKHFETTQTMT